jgi:hypothetical protein
VVAARVAARVAVRVAACVGRKIVHGMYNNTFVGLAQIHFQSIINAVELAGVPLGTDAGL